MTSPKTSYFVLLIALLVGAISLGAGIYTWTSMRAPVMPGREGALIVLPEPRTVADFSLIDHHSKPFNRARLEGRWSLIFFGFTHCPDICPGTLYTMQQARENLAERLEPGQLPQFIFVSVDPERDDPATLRTYVSHFDPEIIGVTGEHAQLLPVTLQMGIAYHIGEHEEGDRDYTVDHSAGIVLINPDGNVAGLFPAPHEAGAIADSMMRKLDG